MFGKSDRIIIQELYAKLYAMDKKFEEMKSIVDEVNRKCADKFDKMFKEEEDTSVFLNQDGLYNVKDYREKARANALKKKRTE